MTPQTALNLATTLHKGQKRKTGEDYIEHPIRVCRILKTFHSSEETLIAGMLHDVCEKTTADYQEIKEKFGKKIKQMVYALSKEKPTHQTKQQQLNTYSQKLHDISHEYPEVLLIKMADQLDNLSSLFVFPPEAQSEKIKEIRELFLPIYHKRSENFPKNLKTAFSILLNHLISTIEKIEKNLRLIYKFDAQKKSHKRVLSLGFSRA